jgi:formylglycine-generating enzyme required for sulfatase activity
MKKHLIISLFLSVLAACSGPGDVKIRSIDTGVSPESWAVVPAGAFFKGKHNHEATLDYDYEIMVTEVTNAQYARYLNKALAEGAIKVVGSKVVGYYPGDPFQGYKHEFEIKKGDKLHLPLGKPGLRIGFDGRRFTVEKGWENHPVVMVTWFGAKAYADFYGWRLPTEDEWEKAARGTDKRAYPWGDEISLNQANFYCSRDPFEETFGKQGGTTPVGFYNGRKYNGYQTKKGQSPYGLYDMAGNVWEWVGDDYPYVHYRYLRGGSKANYDYNLCVWARNSSGPDYYEVSFGFRCARDRQ